MAALAHADDRALLCVEGAYIFPISLRDVKPGDNRIDLVPAHAIRIELINVPTRLHEVANVEAMLVHGYDESAMERFASVSMSCGVLPIRFEGANFCDIPVAVSPRTGEVTVCARSKRGGVGYTVKQPFDEHARLVQVDVSSLGFVAALVDLDVKLSFPVAYPSGPLRLALFDHQGSCLTYAETLREGEPSLGLSLKGLRPGKYVPELQVEREHRSIRFTSIEVTNPSQPVHFVVNPTCRIDLLVQCAEPRALEVAGVLLWDDSGRLHGGASRRDGALGRYRLEYLNAGAYYLQVLAQDHAMASPVVDLHLREGDAQQISTVLQTAGRVKVSRSTTSTESSSIVLIGAGGLRNRFFMTRSHESFWCPVGRYGMRVGEKSFELSVQSGETSAICID